MRILFITPTLPVPTTGGRTRLYNLVRLLADQNEIYIISFVQPHERDMLSYVKPYCRHIEIISFNVRSLGKWENRIRGWGRLLFSRRPGYAYTFPVDSMRPALRRLLSDQVFDLAVFEELFLVELLEDVVDIPVMIVEYNIESDLAQRQYRRATHPIHKLRDWLTWRKLFSFEHHWVQHFPVCVAVSERDAALLNEISPKTHVYIVPNGADSQYFAPPCTERHTETLLFFGTLSYGPNVDGLIWFCKNVLPIIKGSKPNVMLEIVGFNLVPEVETLGHIPGVHITGFVPDIRSKLWSATMCVVPLNIGGGTRLKILEAMAAGCPVISTTVGAEGLSLLHGIHLIIADSAEDFARGVIILLESPELRRRLSESGRQVVAQKYDWRQIVLSFESICWQACHQLAGIDSP